MVFFPSLPQPALFEHLRLCTDTCLSAACASGHTILNLSTYLVPGLGGEGAPL